MRFNDRTGHVQAYPSLSSIVHKMWTPQTLRRLRLHSCAAVTYANRDACGITVGADHESPVLGHGFERVHDDVHQGALDLILESEDFHRTALQLEADLDTLAHGSRRD
jgi:hypothetical protein